MARPILAPPSNMINSASPLVFGSSGGSLIVNGSATGTSQTFPSTTVNNDSYAGIGAVSERRSATNCAAAPGGVRAKSSR